MLPHVLGASGLLPDTDLLASTVKLAIDEWSEFSIPWASVLTSTDCITLTLTDERGFDPALDLISSLAAVSTQIPVKLARADYEEPDGPIVSDIRRIRLGRSCHYALPSGPDARRAMASLVSSDWVRDELVPTGLSRLTFEAEGSSVGASKILISVEPSRNKSAWLYVSSTLEWASSDEEDDLLDRAATNWVKASGLAASHQDWLIEDLRRIVDNTPSTRTGIDGGETNVD